MYQALLSIEAAVCIIISGLPLASNEACTPVLCNNTSRPSLLASSNDSVSPSPATDIDKFDLFSLADIFLAQSTCTEFLKFLPHPSQEDLQQLQILTTGQNENEYWHKLRKGRITASIFYSVFTKVNSVYKNPDTDCSALLKNLMGYTYVNPNIKSLKHGRETEPIAVDNYLASYRKTHKNVLSSKCGIFIDENCIFLGASPDLLVSCSCCGKGMLEVKCPLIPECTKCPGFCICNLPEYIVNVNGVFNVKKNHKYYVQVQGQLAVTKRLWCDLYIYTCNGALESRIVFNQSEYNKSLLPNLNFFFEKYIVPELLHKHLKSSLQECQTSVVTASVDTNKYRYFCPICNKIVKESENVVLFSERSIGCDKCNLWYHFKCVNLKQSDIKKMSEWYCQNCSK